MSVTEKTANYVLNLFHGFRNTSVLTAACKLELFDEIEKRGHVMVQSLTADLKWNPDATERLLNTLVAMDMLQKGSDDEGRVTFYNNDHSAYLLRHRTPNVWAIHHDVEIFRQELEEIPDVIRGLKNPRHEHGCISSSDDQQETSDGRCKYGLDHLHGRDNQADNPKPIAHVHGKNGGRCDVTSQQVAGGKQQSRESWEGECGDCGNDVDGWNTMAGYLEPYVHKIITAFDLSKYKTVVDLGGGAGNLARALCRQYQDMHVTVLDRELVINTAKEIHEKELQPNEKLNVTYTVGDFFKEIPKADLYTLSQVMHHFDEKQWSTLLTKMSSQLSTGGAVMLLDGCLDESKTGPVEANMMDLVLLGCGGRVHTLSEYKSLFQKHGFTDVKVARIGGECQNPIIAFKSRKRKR